MTCFPACPTESLSKFQLKYMSSTKHFLYSSDLQTEATSGLLGSMLLFLSYQLPSFLPSYFSLHLSIPGVVGTRAFLRLGRRFITELYPQSQLHHFNHVVQGHWVTQHCCTTLPMIHLQNLLSILFSTFRDIIAYTCLSVS